MEVSISDFSWILIAFSIWLTMKVFFKLHAHFKLINRIRNAGVPGIRLNPVVGLLPCFLRCVLYGPKNIPITSAMLPLALGMAKIFQKEGMCRLDVGWIKQVVTVYAKEVVEAVLNDPKELKKSDEYKFFSDLVGSGLITASYERWRKHRRVISPAFNSRVIESFQSIMYNHSKILVQSIKTELRGGPVDIDDLLSMCSLGVISETAMGIKFDFRSKEDIAYITAVKEVENLVTRRMITPWLWPEFFFRLSPSGRELRKNMKTVNHFVREIINRKKEEIGTAHLNNQSEILVCKQRPFLELLFLHNANCGEADKFSDQEIMDETLTFTLTGFENIGTTLNWVVFYMGLYPDVKQKAWIEVDTVMQGDKERDINLEDLKQMEYLENIIKEAQRVRPPVPILMRILRHDITVGNKTLPKGTPVAIDIESLHKRPDVFPDPEKFDPDRFKDAKLEPCQFIPFSAGPRICIAQMYAVLEMKTILSTLIRNLDWKSLDHADSVLTRPDIVSRSHKPLTFLFWERS